eukprot:TRINITY_DN43242_c0_g1_i1.p1 TRINITY_DN43242_c0_g1~~TRINITY_DN43242_c0_g1_i1.p1  ORF type:complete len:358 (-),score=54.14 TRINITY_DN43242_c0_g1_i1:74-1147(-)
MAYTPAGPSGNRTLGLHRLALVNTLRHQEGIVDDMISRICNQTSVEKCPHFIKLSTEIVRPPTHESTGVDSTSYLAISDDNAELDGLIEAAEFLQLEEGGGSLSVLGRSPFNSSRLSVEELRRVVRAQDLKGVACWCNLIVAAVMAAVGLATDSTATVVASMLVSPLMSPIIQMAFALVDAEVRSEQGFVRNAIRDTIFAFGGCVAVGFILAPVFIWGNMHRDWHWPTNEMSSRTHAYQTLLPGAIIGVISGVGMANGLRNRGVNALVGVAISASLLPPLVNSGIYMAWGLIYMQEEDHDVAVDRFYRGLISFLLTMFNVFGVMASAAIWFRIRGVGSVDARKGRGKAASAPLLAGA